MQTVLDFASVSETNKSVESNFTVNGLFRACPFASGMKIKKSLSGMELLKMRFGN